MRGKLHGPDIALHFLGHVNNLDNVRAVRNGDVFETNAAAHKYAVRDGRPRYKPHHQ
jgi:hypothetical protein